jgi:hypothetical protein
VTLEEAVASIPSRVKATKIIIDKLGPWLSQYHGGMPLGFLAAILQWESGGKADTSGDPSLGEYGYLQVTPDTAKKFGIDPAQRLNPEWNIFLGSLLYNVKAIELRLYNSKVRLGTEDSWKLARLSAAVGAAGTRKLIDLAQPTQEGHVFDAIRDYVDRTGGVQLSAAQPAEKVRFRVHAVDVVWAVGEKAYPAQTLAMPARMPAPFGVYTVPTSVASFLPMVGGGSAVVLALIAGAVLFFLLRSKQ